MLLRWLCAVLALAAATAAERPPRCQRESLAAGSLRVFCYREEVLLLRLSYAAAVGAHHSSLVMWCDPLQARRDDYQELAALSLTLGAVRDVVLSLCPLPAGRLVDFLRQLGVTGVQRASVQSHSVLNETMPADFLAGLDVASLRLDSLSHVELSDDVLRSAGGLYNFTIMNTDVRLPERLFQHTPRLRRLVVHDVNAGELPPRLLHGLPELSTLVLGRSELRSLTREHFRDLARLRQLYLYRNKLETLPADLFEPLPNLEVLKLQDNPFRSLPAGLLRGLDQLELLSLDRLRLRQLPAGVFSGLSGLRNLTLGGNRLSELAEDVFSNLTSLQNLDLGHNRLRQLPGRVLKGLVSLDTLRLNHNNLTGLPGEMFAHASRLERLFLQGNRLTAVDRWTFVGLGESLRVLDLSNNSLRLDDHESAFLAVSGLRELRLDRNQIRQLPEELRLSLLKLKVLDLRHNQLHSLSVSDLNFLCDDADIYLQHNNISTVAPLPELSGRRRSPPNRIHIGDNPLSCDCRLYWLKRYTEREEAPPGPSRLETAGLRCARPPALAGRPLAELSADLFTCPLPGGCPDGCRCDVQPARRAVVATCAALPRQPLPPLDGLPDYQLSLNLERAGLRRLGNVTWGPAPVADLLLDHNAIGELSAELLPPGLRRLSLRHNNVSTVPREFLELLDRPESDDTQLWLGHNPFLCDCALLPLMQFLQLQASSDRRRIMDADQMRCAGGKQALLQLKPEQLCPSHTAVIVGVCVAALVVLLLLLIALYVYHRHGELLKVWLYDHNLCLWLVTEEELDADKKYDAFVSYSHLDEQFVVEQLVPQLERGEPKYSLCLHFRDWLAGEWITEQIHRSVQDSRRVIVVMSQNFIQSEWGRMEFLTAHKQALSDKRNRIILVVYGELPDPAAMDPELRLYITTNTYLKWGDARFWERLRYALPHKGRRLKPSAARRRHASEKLNLISRENGAGPTAAAEAARGHDDHVV